MTPTISTTAILLAALVSTPYDRVRDSAQAVSNLGRFLEEYVGDCEHDAPGFDRKGCEAKAKDAREKYRGRTLLLELEGGSDQISVAEFDQTKGMFRVHLTPFFSERGLGLSVGKPSRLTAEGYPVVKNVPIWVKLPKDESEFIFRRDLERGNVRIELLVRPQRAWVMKAKSGEVVRGAEVALAGVRVYGSRGSAVLAEQTY
jgi:hypothetical protein